MSNMNIAIVIIVIKVRQQWITRQYRASYMDVLFMSASACGLVTNCRAQRSMLIVS